MFSRAHNRNTVNSDNLFSQNTRIDNNTLGSIDGATALKLDESFQLDEHEQNYSENIEDQFIDENSIKSEKDFNNFPSGVSIESASYMENNNLAEKEISTSSSNNNNVDYTPKLFSDDNNNLNEEINNSEDQDITESNELFDQESNEEEDFEIPAFLRKQKF